MVFKTLKLSSKYPLEFTTLYCHGYNVSVLKPFSIGIGILLDHAQAPPRVPDPRSCLDDPVPLPAIDPLVHHRVLAAVLVIQNTPAEQCGKEVSKNMIWHSNMTRPSSTCPCRPRPSWDAPWPWEATPCPRGTAPAPVCPPPPPPSGSPRHSGTRSVCPCTRFPCTSSIWRNMCSVSMYEDNFLNILLW